MNSARPDVMSDAPRAAKARWGACRKDSGCQMCGGRPLAAVGELFECMAAMTAATGGGIENPKVLFSHTRGRAERHHFPSLFRVQSRMDRQAGQPDGDNPARCTVCMLCRLVYPREPVRLKPGVHHVGRAASRILQSALSSPMGERDDEAKSMMSSRATKMSLIESISILAVAVCYARQTTSLNLGNQYATRIMKSGMSGALSSLWPGLGEVGVSRFQAWRRNVKSVATTML